MEEQVLFPLFDEQVGLRGGGPTAVMRAEHVLIRRSLGDLQRASTAADAGAFAKAAEDLAQVIGPHNLKEERVLYPISDELAGSPERRAQVVASMRTLAPR
jgi:iron-sulfur cluster repair protein YtfE (RIC family)